MDPMSPPSQNPPVQTIGMSFPDAMRYLIAGKMIKRMSWKGELSYGLLKDGFLMIYIRGDFFKWNVNDGDLLANDWVVIEQQN
jgi:hypothetical protein